MFLLNIICAQNKNFETESFAVNSDTHVTVLGDNLTIMTVSFKITNFAFV